MTHKQTSRQTQIFSMYKEAESRSDKIESTSNNVQMRKKQQHRRRACDLLASLKRFYWPNTWIPMCLNRRLYFCIIVHLNGIYNYCGYISFAYIMQTKVKYQYRYLLIIYITSVESVKQFQIIYLIY